MNMDCCFSEAMNYNMDGIQRTIWLYDIMCQYWKNLKKRFEGNPYLDFPEESGDSQRNWVIPCAWSQGQMLSPVCTNIHS
jgi:hypothetical protein